jgi:hypothetical protein
MYHNKYLKYKNKYAQLKKSSQTGGDDNDESKSITLNKLEDIKEMMALSPEERQYEWIYINYNITDSDFQMLDKDKTIRICFKQTISNELNFNTFVNIVAIWIDVDYNNPLILDNLPSLRTLHLGKNFNNNLSLTNLISLKNLSLPQKFNSNLTLNLINLETLNVWDSYDNTAFNVVLPKLKTLNFYKTKNIANKTLLFTALLMNKNYEFSDEYESSMVIVKIKLND